MLLRKLNAEILRKGGTINILDLRLRKIFISAGIPSTVTAAHSSDTSSNNSSSRSSSSSSSSVTPAADKISSASLVALLTSFGRLGITKSMLPNTSPLIIDFFAALAGTADRRTFLATLRCLSSAQVMFTCMHANIFNRRVICSLSFNNFMLFSLDADTHLITYFSP